MFFEFKSKRLSSRIHPQNIQSVDAASTNRFSTKEEEIGIGEDNIGDPKILQTKIDDEEEEEKNTLLAIPGKGKG